MSDKIKLTPEQIEARKAEIAKKRQEFQEIEAERKEIAHNMNLFAKQYNVHTVYRRYFNEGELSPKGGLTIVWHHNRQDSFVTIATEVCSRQDYFVRELGRTLALNNLLHGRCIRIPIPKGETPEEAVYFFFGRSDYIEYN